MVGCRRWAPCRQYTRVTNKRHMKQRVAETKPIATRTSESSAMALTSASKSVSCRGRAVDVDVEVRVVSRKCSRGRRRLDSRVSTRQKAMQRRRAQVIILSWLAALDVVAGEVAAVACQSGRAHAPAVVAVHSDRKDVAGDQFYFVLLLWLVREEDAVQLAGALVAAHVAQWASAAAAAAVVGLRVRSGVVLAVISWGQRPRVKLWAHRSAARVRPRRRHGRVSVVIQLQCYYSPSGRVVVE